MNRKILFTLLFLASLSYNAFATEATKEISSLVVQSYSANSSNSKANSTYLWISAGAWSASVPYCSESRAYVDPDDKHMIASLLTFWSTGKTITLTVDDSRPKKDGGCQVVAVRGE